MCKLQVARHSKTRCFGPRLITAKALITEIAESGPRQGNATAPIKVHSALHTARRAPAGRECRRRILAFTNAHTIVPHMTQADAGHLSGLSQSTVSKYP